MTTPAIRALKETFPESEITLLSSKSGVQIAPLVPEIDHSLLFTAPWMKAGTHEASSQTDQDMVGRLRQIGFDAAVIFTVFSQNPLGAAYLCYLADIPLRLGYCRENPYALLTHWVREIEPQHLIRHEVKRQIDLVKEIGAESDNDNMRIAITATSINSIYAILNTHKINIRLPWVVIHPGATAESRRYPAEQFAEVVKLLKQGEGMQILFTGSKEERDLVRRIQNIAGVESVSLAGKLGLDEMAALLKLAPLLISNNSGPVHLAAAVGTPVVDIYALTNPQHTPWGVPNRVLNHDVPCKFCYKSICPEGHHRCLRMVTPQMVVTAVNDLLAEIQTRVCMDQVNQ